MQFPTMQWLLSYRGKVLHLFVIETGDSLCKREFLNKDTSDPIGINYKKCGHCSRKLKKIKNFLNI